ncbi:MAG: DUF1934 family protein [Oscillospiraceae bacterium]|nr:DUF1934 family protein [Oscillospiraceae bacterium]
MGGLSNPEEGKYNFNFKVKIVQTDLASREYLFGTGFSEGFGFGGDLSVYQNSSYISKLYFINNYSGGILAKDKIEDMPERYRRFINLNNPTDAEMIKNFREEMAMLADREEIGQNVFYSSLSNPSVYSEPVIPSNKLSQINQPTGEYTEHTEIFENLESFDGFNVFEDFGNFDGGDIAGIYGDGGNDENEECGESIGEDYRDDEEIKDILLLNNIFNSEMYKMSKVEYDFSVLGNISVTSDGSLDIKYDESEMTGYKDSYIQFLFRADNREIVTVRRKYIFDTWFTLEKGKRVSVEIRDRYSGAVATTSTQELVNNITLDGGDMKIAYTTETDGVPTESVLYSIHAEPVSS